VNDDFMPGPPTISFDGDHQPLHREQYEDAGGKGHYDRGVFTSTLSKWSEFYAEVARFRGYEDYVWRGQEQHGEGWTLRSKFDRLSRNGHREIRLERHRKEFAESIMGRRGPNPPELSEDNLWALGQHHGLATPLLDWTRSPFVAAYFAFHPNTMNNSERVVYALHRDIERWHGSKIREVFIEFPQTTSHENVRLLAQGGVFTKALDGEDVKTYIQKFYRDKEHETRIILLEILIRDSCREKCLHDLNWMNINHATLFPDMDGAAAFCNWKLSESGGSTLNSGPK
jgi:hypothetical protein